MSTQSKQQALVASLVNAGEIKITSKKNLKTGTLFHYIGDFLLGYTPVSPDLYSDDILIFKDNFPIAEFLERNDVLRISASSPKVRIYQMLGQLESAH